MRELEYEELIQRTKDTVEIWKKAIPGYREQVLERLIEREMYNEAAALNSKLDYEKRCEEAKAHRGHPDTQVHTSTFECVCAKIRELFK